MAKRHTSLALVKAASAGSSSLRRSVNPARFDHLGGFAKRLSSTTALLLCAMFVLAHSAHAVGVHPAINEVVEKKCDDLWAALLPHPKQQPKAAAPAVAPKAEEKPAKTYIEENEEKPAKTYIEENGTGRYIANFKDLFGKDLLEGKLEKEIFKKKCLSEINKVEKFKLGKSIQFTTSFLTLYNLTSFIASLTFWMGLISVMMFAMTRFKVTLPGREKLSPPLTPRSFTTAFRYWIASFTYMGCYATLYLAVLLIGSIPGVHRQVLDYLAGQFTTEVATPAWAALLATTVLPAVWPIGPFDAWLRMKLQEFASIPDKARAIADDVLAALTPREPTVITKSTADVKDKLIGAIKSHKERLTKLWNIKHELEDIADSQLSQRYSTFFGQNAEIERTLQAEVLQAEVPSESEEKGLTTLSAYHIEDSYRSTIPKVARFLVCAMLSAEGTEPRVRDRLIDDLKISVERSVFRFHYGLVILVPFAIFIAVLMSCFIAAGAYHFIGKAIQKLPEFHELPEFHAMFSIFIGWSLQTILIYLPPITVAAAAAMYLLDRSTKTPNKRLQWAEYLWRAVAVLLTLLATGMLCFFILLGLGILLPRQLGDETKVMMVSEVWPWAIPPALLATSFMWLSFRGLKTRKSLSQALSYGLILGIVAAGGSLLASQFLNDSRRAALISPLPGDMWYYLVCVTPFFLGLSLGFVLSTTREPLSGQSVAEQVSRPQGGSGASGFHWGES